MLILTIVAAFIALTKLLSSLSILILSAKLFWIILTVAEPEIAPVAPAFIACWTYSGFEIPNPSIGLGASYSLSFANTSSTSIFAAVSVPVTPTLESK